jgi:hypothetical protein
MIKLCVCGLHSYFYEKIKFIKYPNFEVRYKICSSML